MTVSEKKALKIRLQLSAGGVTGQDNFFLGTRVQDAPGSLASVILPSCANLPLQQTAYLSCQTACLPTSLPEPLQLPRVVLGHGFCFQKLCTLDIGH